MRIHLSFPEQCLRYTVVGIVLFDSELRFSGCDESLTETAPSLLPFCL